MRYSISTALVYLFIAAPAIAQDRCADILKDGVFDFSEIRTDREFMQAWDRYAKSSSLKDRMKKSGTSLAGQDGLKSGNFATNNDDAEKLFYESINWDKGTETEFTRYVQVARVASEAITNAWKECMKGPGLVLTLRRSMSKDTFWVVARYESTNVTQPIATITVISDSPKALKCGNASKISAHISRSERAITCKRSSNVDVALHVETGAFVLRPGHVSTFSVPKTPVARKIVIAKEPLRCREAIVGVFYCRGKCGGGPNAEARVNYIDTKAFFYNEIGQKVEEGFWADDERRISLSKWRDGSVNSDCNTISWGTGAVWIRKGPPDWKR